MDKIVVGPTGGGVVSIGLPFVAMSMRLRVPWVGTSATSPSPYWIARVTTTTCASCARSAHACDSSPTATSRTPSSQRLPNANASTCCSASGALRRASSPRRRRGDGRDRHRLETVFAEFIAPRPVVRTESKGSRVRETAIADVRHRVGLLFGEDALQRALSRRWNCWCAG